MYGGVVTKKDLSLLQLKYKKDNTVFDSWFCCFCADLNPISIFCLAYN